MMAFTAITFTACSKDNDDDGEPQGISADPLEFVGNWALTSKEGYDPDGSGGDKSWKDTYTTSDSPEIITFAVDGSFTYKGGGSGTWNFQNGKLTITAEGDSPLPYTVTKLNTSQLVLEWGKNNGSDYYEKSTYTKVDTPVEPEPASVDRETLSAKWEVSDSDNPYISFEFNESGSYIVLEKGSTKSTADTIIHFGQYTISHDTIILGDFGTLKVVELGSDVFWFSITTCFSGKKTEVSTKKAAEMAGSARTDLLCKTWNIKYYGDDVVLGTVLFSKAGTYFVHYYDDEEGGLAQWRWKDSNEKELLYTWDWNNWNSESSGIVTINMLTKNYLKVTEAFEDGTADVWELTPYQDGTKSSVLTKSTAGILNKAKTGRTMGIFRK